MVAPILPLYTLEFGVAYTAAGALITGFTVRDWPSRDQWGHRRSVGTRGWPSTRHRVLAVSSVTAALAPNCECCFNPGSSKASARRFSLPRIADLLNHPRERLGRATACPSPVSSSSLPSTVRGRFACRSRSLRARVLGLHQVRRSGFGVRPWLLRRRPTVEGTSAHQLFGAAAQPVRTRSFVSLMLIAFSMMFMRSTSG